MTSPNDVSDSTPSSLKYSKAWCLDGRIVMIDPKLPDGERFCYLDSDDSSCERFIVGHSIKTF